MDSSRFDSFARARGTPTSRRVASRVLTALGLSGLLPLANGAVSAAAKSDRTSKKKLGKRRKSQPKVKFNQFGCVNVGKFCKKNRHCCSGICTGAAGKKTCQGHNTGFTACEDGGLGLCTAPGDSPVAVFLCTSSSDKDGFCTRTTGNAPYCAASAPDLICAPTGRLCTKDKDCQPFCGPDAACVLCPRRAVDNPGVTRACAGPSPDSCQF